jgi:hypothetical protein
MPVAGSTSCLPIEFGEDGAQFDLIGDEFAFLVAASSTLFSAK